MWKLCINFFVSHTVTRTDHSPAGSHTHQRRITFASEVSILLERAQSHSVSGEAVKLSHSLQSSAMARGESGFLIHCWLSTWQRLTWHDAMTLSGSCPWLTVAVSASKSSIRRFVITEKAPTHGEIIYGGTRWIEDDYSATFSEYIFLFPACLMISHWLTKNAELNSVF